MREHVSGMNPRAGTLHHGVFCVYGVRPLTFVYHSGTVALCGQEALRRITVSGFRR